MQKSIKITFPVKKKNQDDTYRAIATYTESEGGRCFTLNEDLITDEVFRCIGVTFTEGKSKFPIMLVEPA